MIRLSKFFILNLRRESWREIQVKIDYWEVIKKVKEVKKRKNFPKNEVFYVNVIPYIHFLTKLEIEKVGNIKSFKMLRIERIFWLRIFSTDDLYVAELMKPIEKSIDFEWNSHNSGGARFNKDETSGKTKENPHWPLNPQFLVNFEASSSLKIVVKKTTGHFLNEEIPIGFMVTKPENKKVEFVANKIKVTRSTNKNDQIQR